MWAHREKQQTHPDYSSPSEDSSPSNSPFRRHRARRQCTSKIFAELMLVCLLIWWGIRNQLMVWMLQRGSFPYSFSMDNYNNLTNGSSWRFLPPEPVPYRAPDSIDSFASFKYRGTCNISSLDLHTPFYPLCQSRSSMMTAMAGGGRPGFDAPFIPRGCDMRWFAAEEACEILSRFDKILIVGDSMMRHVTGSINVLLRKDLGYGAVTDWNFSPEERRECFCNMQFNVKACSVQGIFKTEDVIKNDPNSFSCGKGNVNMLIEEVQKFPIPPDELARYTSHLPAKRPKKPIAFIHGHGLWNDLSLQATLDWLDALRTAAVATAPWLAEPIHGSDFNSFPSLILTPNAAGKLKPDEWLRSQGNKAIMIFEESVRIEAARRGVEHLGTWNMSIQANKYDGVHVDLKGNLVKGMMVLNWLNMLDVQGW